MVPPKIEYGWIPVRFWLSKLEVPKPNLDIEKAHPENIAMARKLLHELYELEPKAMSAHVTPNKDGAVSIIWIGGKWIDTNRTWRIHMHITKTMIEYDISDGIIRRGHVPVETQHLHWNPGGGLYPVRKFLVSDKTKDPNPVIDEEE